MNRMPQIGDMLMIGLVTKPIVVVEYDRLTQIMSVVPELKLDTPNPKLKHYKVTLANVTTPGLALKYPQVVLSDLFLLDHIKIKTITHVTYKRK